VHDRDLSSLLCWTVPFAIAPLQRTVHHSKFALPICLCLRKSCSAPLSQKAESVHRHLPAKVSLPSESQHHVFCRVWQTAKRGEHLSRRWLWHAVAFGDNLPDLLIHALPYWSLQLPAGVPNPLEHQVLLALHCHGTPACDHTLPQPYTGMQTACLVRTYSSK